MKKALTAYEEIGRCPQIRLRGPRAFPPAPRNALLHFGQIIAVDNGEEVDVLPLVPVGFFHRCQQVAQLLPPAHHVRVVVKPLLAPSQLHHAVHVPRGVADCLLEEVGLVGVFVGGGGGVHVHVGLITARVGNSGPGHSAYIPTSQFRKRHSLSCRTGTIPSIPSWSSRAFAWCLSAAASWSRPQFCASSFASFPPAARLVWRPSSRLEEGSGRQGRRETS